MVESKKYRHFKGKEYELLMTAKHSESEEEYAVYRQLYGDYSVWIRPLAMFEEWVEVDGRRVKRFARISE